MGAQPGSVKKNFARIGILGLGLIGSALAGRLSQAGFALCGFDPDEERQAAFAKNGGQACAIGEIWQADAVFSAVFDTGQLAEIIAGAPHQKTAGILVSLSTCDPGQMQGLAELALEKNIRLIEAPISGTSAAFAKGDVLLMVAGNQETMGLLDSVFPCICREYVYAGEIGNGNRAKLAINLVLGLNRAAVAEGMVFANSVGLSPEDFLKIAKASAAHSTVMDSKGDLMASLMANGEFPAQGRIVQSAKDFALISDAAAAKGQGLPFTKTYLEMMHNAIESGEGDLDNSAVLLPIKRSKPV